MKSEKGNGKEQHEHSAPFGPNSELFFNLACGLLTAVGWTLEKLGTEGPWACGTFIVAYVIGAWFPAKEVFEALRERKFQIDFLMLLAAGGAAALGEWFEGSLLLFLYTLGHALEGVAMRRARNAISALGELLPQTAVRVDGLGVEREVSVDILAIGDILRVKPNTRIPADGLVVEGSSSVNQAPITGESVPVDKIAAPNWRATLESPEKVPAQHVLFAGTINGTSALTMAVARLTRDSTLSRVARMVEEAESAQSPTQQFAKRFERIFVPTVLVIVALLLFAPLVLDEAFSRSVYRALAVLVAASPCALAIATPSAVLAGVARAARGGVLVKGGAHLEALGLVRAIAFDKTGTLTEGKPRLTDVLPFADVEAADLLGTAVAIERLSDHPLASAITKAAGSGFDFTRLEAKDVEAIVGYGVCGTVSGEKVTIGKPGLFTEELHGASRDAVARLQSRGRTVMIVRKGSTFLGALGVMDVPRPNANSVVASLKRLGIEQTIMLTGDNQRVANAVAGSVGIDTARGDLLPDQKVEAIIEMARNKRRVAMVGDGVNDAPAMAHATVGIAMGAGGSHVALEAADVALMADDLSALPFAVGLSRKARSIIRQNLWMSLGMVAFLIPATLLGFAGIGLAVTLHEGSTLVVVANALRLLGYSEIGVE